MLLTLFIRFSVLSGQTPAPAFDGHTWKAPYHLPEPTGWGIERFQVPVSFAPAIRYTGVEDIRFAPGWAKADNEEYWSYTFLWWLNGKLTFTEQIITRNLQAYYDGLLKVNTDSARYAALNPEPAIANIRQISTQQNDKASFEGHIRMTDYMTLKPITLYCRFHLRYCKKARKTVLFHELSPQHFSHAVWKQLNQLWLDFTCAKNK